MKVQKKEYGHKTYEKIEIGHKIDFFNAVALKREVR